MSADVYVRIHETAPKKSVSSMDKDQLLRECKVGFEVIGYQAKNLENSFEAIFKFASDCDLSDFIYRVWRYDNEFQ